MFSIFLLDVDDDIFVQKKKIRASIGEHGCENVGGGGGGGDNERYQEL